MRRVITLCISLVLFAAVAFAHGDEQHLMGTVTKITDKSITIEMKDKKTTEVALTPETKCMKGDATAALKDVKVGDRVVVNAKKDGDKLVATMVKMGTGAGPTHKH
jgi:hypothetical protein